MLRDKLLHGVSALSLKSGVATTTSYEGRNASLFGCGCAALLHLPVIDRPAVRAHMARVIHHSLLGEVTAMQKSLDRLVEQSHAATQQGRRGTIRTSTVANRLSEYRAMRAKIELYGEILGA